MKAHACMQIAELSWVDVKGINFKFIYNLFAEEAHVVGNFTSDHVQNGDQALMDLAHDAQQISGAADDDATSMEVIKSKIHIRSCKESDRADRQEISSRWTALLHTQKVKLWPSNSNRSQCFWCE